ncbi:MAG: PilZ domain-containing protein [Pseudobdellovibrio sp.]
MKSILDELVHIEKSKAYQILNKAADYRTGVQVKLINENKILNVQLQKIGIRKHFYIKDKSELLASQPEVTIKVIAQNNLYFLKTQIKKNEQSYYFDNFDHLYELVRRKKPRFSIPTRWAQSAVIHGTKTPYELKSAVKIIEMSKAGMKLDIKADLPAYEKNQTIKIKFKIFRRGEIALLAKIIHIKKSKTSGPMIGIQFLDESTLLKNKIQNICDDLAFYFASEAMS